MTQIKIEVPANDHIALSAMAEALQRIATERAPSDDTGVTQSDAETYGKAWSEHYGSNTEQPTDDMLVNADIAFQALQNEGVVPPKSAVDTEAFEASECVVTVNESDMDAEPVDPSRNLNTEQNDTLDADGIPHDKRIHSKGATRLADNTWRLRKRPADKTEDEWTTYIDSVKAELKAVQDIPTLDEQAVADLTPPVMLTEEQAREEIKDKLESGEVTVEAPLTPPVIDEPVVQLEGVTPNGDVAIEPPVTTTGEPVAPVTPPTSLTPPVAEADKPNVTTFQELMLYMTSDAKKRGADNDMIKETLLEVDPALTAIPLIATRADLIPKFVEALEAKLS